MCEPHVLEDCSTWKIPNTDWIIQGFSQAGNRTGFIIPSLKICFDAGVTTHKTPEAVLLTHTHADHSFAIPCIAMGRKRSCRVYCPSKGVDPLRLMCRASQSLNDCAQLCTEEQVHCEGVLPGDEFALGKKRQITVRVVECMHTVPSVGYQLVETKNVLKPQYRGLPGKEIGKLRRGGTCVTEATRVVRFTFLGDTTIQVFDKLLPTEGTVMVECTILDDSLSPEETAERGHIHFRQLWRVAEAHPDTTFMLIHFSKKYSEEEIARAMTTAPPNVYAWNNYRDKKEQ